MQGGAPVASRKVDQQILVLLGGLFPGRFKIDEPVSVRSHEGRFLLDEQQGE